MQIEILADDEALARRAADLVAETLAQKPDASLMFPTGNTPVKLFRELVRRVQNNEIDFSQTKILELDDYFGIGLDDERNLYHWLKRELIDPAGIDPSRVTRFYTDATDAEAEVMRMASVVKEQGIDLLFLGLGPNGHLGFNEPGTCFDASVQIVDLTPESIVSNAKYFGDDQDKVPRQGITFGIKSLMQAKEVVLLVSGAHKADILSEVMAAGVQESPEIPAVFLHGHPQARVLADEAAASNLGANPQ
jgi:glucosamine-6-phosphate deaminase